jgi:hypothetical protein
MINEERTQQVSEAPPAVWPVGWFRNRDLGTTPDACTGNKQRKKVHGARAVANNFSGHGITQAPVTKRVESRIHTPRASHRDAAEDRRSRASAIILAGAWGREGKQVHAPGWPRWGCAGGAGSCEMGTTRWLAYAQAAAVAFASQAYMQHTIRLTIRRANG